MIQLIIIAILMPFILFADLSWKSSSGESFSAEAKIYSDAISLTEFIEVRLSLVYPTTYNINIDQLTANLLSHPAIEEPNFTLISVKEDKNNLENSTHQELTWVLKPEAQGQFYLSFFNINFTSLEQGKLEPVNIISDLFEIKISEKKLIPALIHSSNVLPLSANFPIDIDPNTYQKYVANDQLENEEAQRNVQIFQESAFPWIICLLIPLLLLFFYLLKLSPIKSVKALSFKNIHDLALKEIVKLQEHTLPSSQLYEKLDHILRDYCQFQYHIEAPNLTTMEFIQELKSHPEINEKMRNDVIQFIEDSERVKFAKDEPSSEDCVKAEAAVLTLIQ